ncbi:MAG TPA: pitrilysin family protein [Pyrinomonadaceae bacterium]|nr:pitrilysin family protein [Pyrinomonadaceae bacterium]
MRKRFLTVVFGCAIIVTGAIGVNAQTKMPQMKFRERTLANGLRVLSVVDKSNPTVAINVWYHVGSKDDPDQRSGFAHLFEHIMFKSTKNMKSEMMDRLTEDVGGNNNAYTADDVTVYYEVVPSNYLETLLWAEADRLSGLTVDEESFHSERAVVEEEFRQSVLAPPYGKFFYALDQKSYNTHPYKRPTIGSIQDLDAATVENVQKFHTTYYRPDNATLLVVGDFDPKQLDAWVDKYFASIAKPNLPLPRVQTREPERNGEKRFTEYGSNVPLPGVGITYLIPSEKSEDAPALTMADIVLSQGRSSRLYQSLIYQQQVAQSANANADLREDNGLFQLTAIVAAGRKPEDAEASLRAEIKKLQDTPVPAAELEKAKNQIITSELRQRETNLGKAQALGGAAVLLGDPNRVNTDLDRLQAVTAADIQRVAQKYFTDQNRLVLYYLPESQRPPSTGSNKASRNGERGSSPTVREGSLSGRRARGAYAK